MVFFANKFTSFVIVCVHPETRDLDFTVLI